MSEPIVEERGWSVLAEWHGTALKYPTPSTLYDTREAAIGRASVLWDSWFNWKIYVVRHVRITFEVAGEKLMFHHEYVEKYLR